VAEALSSGGIPLMDGILELLDRASQLEVPVVVATGSRREYAETAIRHHRLDRYLSGLVSAYDPGVERGKPEPDVFIVAARSFGANPSRCVAVEDGMPGFLAALRAGMRCYYLAAANRAELPEEARDAMDQGRAAIITSLREVAL
jgi:HAD superfamily hydrolase (TIGR01509 family)